MKRLRMNTGLRTATLPAVLAATMLLVMLAAGGCSHGSAPATSPEDLGLQEIAVEAPDFTLETMKGEQVTLSALRGTPVLLNFWALKCPPCREEMPFLDAAAANYAGQAIVLAIDIGDSPSSVQGYFGDAQLSMIVPLDVAGYAASSYSVGFTPTTFLIDSQGIVRYVKVGPFAGANEVITAMELIVPEA
jgi:thiol-disulfide isomerase/thioredoxin